MSLSYNAAWRMKHKLMQVMLERDNKKPLQSRVELDDSCWGGARRGGKHGRGAADKKPFVAAVQTTEDEKPLKMKLSVAIGFQSEEIGQWSHIICCQEVRWLAMVWRALTRLPMPVVRMKCTLVGSSPESAQHPSFRWVNTMLGNVKNALRGSYHALRDKHLRRYLAEFHYRFNRRYDLPSIISRLLYVAVRTLPMPQQSLTMAESRW
jgi:hypothetical protein